MLRPDRWRWPLIVLIAGILSTPIAYYFVIGGWAPPAANGPQMASVDPIAVAPLTASKDDGVGSLARSGTSSQVTETPPTARSPEAREVAMLQQNETGIQEAPSKTSVRALGADEIKLLMKQGEQFAEVGDLVTARLLFQRAAEAGDAAAARPPPGGGLGRSARPAHAYPQPGQGGGPALRGDAGARGRGHRTADRRVLPPSTRLVHLAAEPELELAATGAPSHWCETHSCSSYPWRRCAPPTVPGSVSPAVPTTT
jgi:hypothetical protein